MTLRAFIVQYRGFTYECIATSFEQAREVARDMYDAGY